MDSCNAAAQREEINVFKSKPEVQTLLTQLEKQRTELVGIYHFAEELAREGFIPLLTTRNIKGIDMMVSNDKGSKSVTFQVKTIQLWNENNDSFPVFTTPGNDAKNHVTDANDLFNRIEESIVPSRNKWWAFVPVENGKVLRYYVAPSEWVMERTKQKAVDYLGIDKTGKITKINRNTGKPLTWGSLGVVGFYIEELKKFDKGLQDVKKALK